MYPVHVIIKHRLTVEEYLALPEEKPYLEYVDGEVVPKMAPDRNHAGIAGELDFRLGLYRREHGGFFGPEGRVEFNDAGKRRFHLPDVAYWAPGRPIGKPIMAPPTLAIEIRSPDEPLSSQREKCRFYRSHGVDVCWLVDPVSRTAEVFEGDRAGAVLSADRALESPFLPGFRLPLGELFAVLDS